MNVENFSDFVYLVSFAVYLFCLAVPVAATLVWAFAQLVGGALQRGLHRVFKKSGDD